MLSFSDNIINKLKKTPFDKHNSVWELLFKDEQIIAEGHFFEKHIAIFEPVFKKRSTKKSLEKNRAILRKVCTIFM